MNFAQLSGDLRLFLATNHGPSTTVESRTVIAATGMVAVWDEPRSRLTPVGCALCYDGAYGQDEHAEPTLKGRPLLRAEENMNLGGALGPAVRANLWLCPACKLPQARLLPRFQ